MLSRPRRREKGDGAARIGYARDMFRKRPACEFIASCPLGCRFPAPLKYEVAFCGRSNVGKSSLLNALTGQAKLARTSKTPGCTRAVNYFKVEGNFHLVDLPGYGYADAPKSVIAAFRELMRDYFDERAPLMIGALLVDLRRGVTDLDLDMVSLFEGHGIPYAVAATKADKLRKQERQRALAALRHDPRLAGRQVVAVSALKGEGILEFDKALDALLAERGIER